MLGPAIGAHNSIGRSQGSGKQHLAEECVEIESLGEGIDETHALDLSADPYLAALELIPKRS